MSDDLEGFLGGGAPGLPFPVKGTSYTLTLTGSPRMMQQFDFDTGEPLEWPDGNPRKQMVLTGTIPEDEWWDEDDHHDKAYDEDFEGEARLYIKSGLRVALRDGLKRAKCKVADLDDGAVVEVTYVKDGPREGKKKPPKIYNIEVTPARKSSKGAAEFLGEDDDEEEEAPPKRRRRAADEDEAPPKRRRRAAPADEDDEDEDEAPPPRRRRTNVTEEVATAKRNSARRSAAAAKKRAAEDEDEDDDEPPF